VYFIGILIEHYTGNLPLRLVPRQVIVATITGDADCYAREVHAAFADAGRRAVARPGRQAAVQSDARHW
jgi:threonyl-tRNA synthetase